jgi:hypothetical protein
MTNQHDTATSQRDGPTTRRFKFNKRTVLLVDAAEDQAAAESILHLDARVLTEQLPVGGFGDDRSLLLVTNQVDPIEHSQQLIGLGVDPVLINFAVLPDGETLASLAQTDLAQLRAVLDHSRHAYSNVVRRVHEWEDEPEREIAPLGDDELSQLIRLRLGSFMVVLGGYGSGKSSVASIMSMRAASQPSSWGNLIEVSVCAWEDELVDYKARLRAFSTCGGEREMSADIATFERRFHWFQPYELGDKGLEQYIGHIEFLTRAFGVKVHVFDPWNSHAPNFETGENELRYINRLTSMLQRKARELDAAIILVTHIPKAATPDASTFRPFRTKDASGSGDFAAKADYGLCIQRTSFFSRILKGEAEADGIPSEVSARARQMAPSPQLIPDQHTVLFADKIKIEATADDPKMGRRGTLAFVYDRAINDLVYDPAATLLAQQVWRP